jgi:hypothetical protein
MNIPLLQVRQWSYWRLALLHSIKFLE